ncbi:NAD-dependent epimerase/dehydratase family protein [Marinoscillum furvescens]|uniref:dTDP-6-deoxy-L-talose 4-dehydrogenase (NAD+) n=1 Tax=Marinoscillum furvescens DSM 4134 TaxID=1122208 RepID=A0A3D9L2F9_MARFU|nr:NAD(P)-dependent oxidoreductase [Marinoscillum furvescens]RED96625.1 dTDP-6-deoxy-L-talose 4-dehydrogenase (NAD+) [Marinoscillum furvescens DSM 4134]
MKVSVIGASGFIGQHTVRELLLQGHHVKAISRNGLNFSDKNLESFKIDVYDCSEEDLHLIAQADALIFLTWPHLSNFKAVEHLTETLPQTINVLEKLIRYGIDNIVFTGTCLEYGLVEGAISPNTPTAPTTPYGLAKDTLRRYLEHHPSLRYLKWGRIFYVYGKGQSKTSLLPQLRRAIHAKETVFRMSKGDQQRDFVEVETVAKRLVSLAELKTTKITNIGSGKPLTVKEFVEMEIKRQNSPIKLDLGFYDYPDYEPMRFWAK